MKKHLMVEAKKIQDICEENRIVLEVEWLRRNEAEIEFCDYVSKDFDLGDYRLSREDFDYINDNFGPFSKDYFASSWSKRFFPYRSKELTPDCEGRDAFATSWENGRGYFHPPTQLIQRVLRYARKQKAQGVLVAPDWTASPFGVEVARLVSRGELKLLEKFKPVFQSRRWVRSTIFKGKSGFDVNVFAFSFK